MDKKIDMHFHVGVLGDSTEWSQYGQMAQDYRSLITFKIFLLYAGIKQNELTDKNLFDRTLSIINGCALDQVVCLALDPVFTNDGKRDPSRSYIWVDNSFILKLRSELPAKVLYGASVHPYDPDFQNRVKKCVDDGAVFIKWLPSAQQFDLADERVKKALVFLATARNGKALPLLLHTGMEYAIETRDPKTKSYDFLSWTFLEDIANKLRFKNAWNKPKVKQLNDNLRAGLDAGATIIFAHCGLPYFASGIFNFAEHSDFDVVKNYLSKNSQYKGKCYADLSALCTPFRKPFFNDIKQMPKDYLLFGSDFPTPAFELSANAQENLSDIKAALEGHPEQLVIPEDNLIDVNYRELHNVFGDHPMFTNFSKLIQ